MPDDGEGDKLTEVRDELRFFPFLSLGGALPREQRFSYLGGSYFQTNHEKGQASIGPPNSRHTEIYVLLLVVASSSFWWWRTCSAHKISV